MNSSRQLRIGAILSYFVLAVNIAIGLLYTPWMIHSIGKENYGLYTLALSVITLFVFDFGLSAAVTRFLSQYISEGKQDKANDCLGLVAQLYLAVDLVLLIILAVVYFFIPSLYESLTPEEMEKFKVVYCIAAFYSVFSFPFIPLNGILTAHEKFVQLRSAELIHKILIVSLMSICLLWGCGLYALVLVNAVAGVVMILIKLYVIKCKTSQGLKLKYFNKKGFVQVLGFSGWVTVCSIAQRFIFNIAPSILAALSGSASVAILGIATGLEAYIYSFSTAISGLLLPKVTKTIHEDEHELLPLMNKVGRIQLYIVGLLVLGFVCFGKDFIQLWVGTSFEDSFMCTVLLILPTVFYVPKEIGNQAILVKNKVKMQAVVYIVMATVNIVLSLFLCRHMGALGMCISICIAYFLRVIGLDLIYSRSIGIDMLAFIKETYIKMLPSLVLLFILGGIINWLLPTIAWVMLIVKILLFTVSYGLIMYTLSFNKYEKSLILHYFKK